MKNYLLESEQAFFAFNIWDIPSACAVIDAAANQQVGVILQTSQRVFEKLPAELFQTYLRGYALNKHVALYLHLDHCRSLETIQHAVDAGWDSVMYDGSALPLEENIKNTRQACDYAHAKDVLVEAEVGSIIGVEDDIVVRESGVASMEDVARMMDETDIDMLAAAFGNAHGLYHGVPNLRFEIIEEIGHRWNIPFVVHGGTGMSDEIFQKLLKYSNVKKINISTDVKQAYREGILKAQQKELLERVGFESTKVADLIHAEIYQMAVQKMQLLHVGE